MFQCFLGQSHKKGLTIFGALLTKVSEKHLRNLLCLEICLNKLFQQKRNKNVDIKFSAQDTFLEQPSSGTTKVKIF
jgi:hypothetical protein